MKKWLSTLLLVVLLAQALPVSAMASVGRVLSDAELDRAYLGRATACITTA